MNQQASEIRLQITYGTVAGLRWVNEHSSQQLPILALHGWLDNANSFVPLAPYLSAVCGEFIALDLAGHGYSDHRAAGAHYHLIDHVFDVVDVVNELGWDQFILLGHSMGVGIAGLVAAALPKRVARLILFDGIGPFSSDSGDVADQLRHSVRLYQRSSSATKQVTYPGWQTLIERREAAGDLGFAAAELLVKRNAKQSGDEIVWLADRRLKLKSPIYMCEQHVLSFLSAIKANTLLIKAEHGLVGKTPNVIRRISALQALKVVDVPGGHYVHMQAPDLVARPVIQFLEELLSHFDDSHFDNSR